MPDKSQKEKVIFHLSVEWEFTVCFECDAIKNMNHKIMARNVFLLGYVLVQIHKQNTLMSRLL